jgi:hypothetical protein
MENDGNDFELAPDTGAFTSLADACAEAITADLSIKTPEHESSKREIGVERDETGWYVSVGCFASCCPTSYFSTAWSEFADREICADAEKLEAFIREKYPSGACEWLSDGTLKRLRNNMRKEKRMRAIAKACGDEVHELVMEAAERLFLNDRDAGDLVAERLRDHIASITGVSVDEALCAARFLIDQELGSYEDGWG